MRRFLTIINILFLMLTLAACAGIRANYRELEQLLIVRTMGIDRESGAVTVSLATDGTNSAPVRASAGGADIRSAISKAQSLSHEGELFFPHIGHMVIGGDSAEAGIEPYMEFICRAPELRIDLNLFVVKNADAKELVCSAGSDSAGIGEILSAMETAAQNRSAAHIFSAAEIISRTDRFGGALMTAIEKSADSEESDDALTTARVCGLGILDNYKLIGYLNERQSAAAGILLNKPYLYTLTLLDSERRRVSLELESGGSEYSVQWNADGTIAQIDIAAYVSASVIEAAGPYTDLDGLTSALEEAVLKDIMSVINEMRLNGCDFIGLAGEVERSAPALYRGIEDFPALLKDIRINVSVSGSIDHTNDTKDGQS